MEKDQIIFFICFASLLLILLLGFLLFILLLQRRKSNRYIREREILKNEFSEQLLKSQLEIQEQSFNIVSMEIHDNVGQTLSLLNVQLNIIDQKEILDKVMLSDAKDSVRKAMVDLRDIAKSLSTDRIHHSSLSEMTAHELKRINQTGVMKGFFRIAGEEQPIQGERKLILFRIIQECFQNIIKHSSAKNVYVNFAYKEEHLEIDINDDGKGFDMDSLLPVDGKGLGLQNIIKRAAVINGEAKIESSVNRGTTVAIIARYA
jgi:two-component system, NarL family, sensor kinase